MSSDRKRHWLISAFEPFAGRHENASMLVIEELIKASARLEPSPDGIFAFHFRVLPVEYDRCASVLLQEIESLAAQGIRLEGVLSLGEGDEELKIETRANNLDDVDGFPDNAGVIREGQAIFKDLPDDAVIPLRFPFDAFSRIRTSMSPGYFVCNHLCAKMARALASDPKAPSFGFIHVPRPGRGGIFTPEIIAAMILNGFRRIPSLPQPVFSLLS